MQCAALEQKVSSKSSSVPSFLLPDYPFAILYPFRWGLIFPEGGEICLFPRTALPSKSALS
jgi:hypothetical protein